MKKRTIITLAAVAMMATACDKNEDKTPRGEVQAVFTANIGNPLMAGGKTVKNLSRVTDVAWDERDAIGIFAITESANKDPQNWKYTRVSGQTGAEAWSSERPFYFKDTGDDEVVITFKAYYPWTANATTGGTIEVDAGDKQTPELQKTIDFMFADKVSDDELAPASTGSKKNPLVNFQFRHCMSKVVFTLLPSVADGVSIEDVKALAAELTGVKSEGTFSLADGTVTASSSVATAIPMTTVVAGNLITVSAIVVPQERAATDDGRLVLANAATNETFNTNNLLNFNLEAGKKYTYTITVRKVGLKITASNITDWISVDKGNGDAVLQ